MSRIIVPLMPKKKLNLFPESGVPIELCFHALDTGDYSAVSERDYFDHKYHGNECDAEWLRDRIRANIRLLAIPERQGEGIGGIRETLNFSLRIIVSPQCRTRLIGFLTAIREEHDTSMPQDMQNHFSVTIDTLIQIVRRFGNVEFFGRTDHT